MIRLRVSLPSESLSSDVITIGRILKANISRMKSCEITEADIALYSSRIIEQIIANAFGMLVLNLYSCTYRRAIFYLDVIKRDVNKHDLDQVEVSKKLVNRVFV